MTSKLDDRDSPSPKRAIKSSPDIMENHLQSADEISVSAWSYRHDWSSDSCSSDEDSSRSSSAEPAHSLHPIEKSSKDLNTSESSGLQEGVRCTASSHEAIRAESSTNL